MVVFLSDKVSCCPTRLIFIAIKTTFQYKYWVVLLLRPGSSTTLNGKNILVNVDHQIYLYCVCVFVVV